MPVYKYQNTAGKTLWYASFYYTDWTGNKKRTTKRGFKTKREATDYERDFKSNVDKKPTILFKRVLDDYLDDCSMRLKPTTMRKKKGLAQDKFLPYFGEMKLCDIDANTIRMWHTELMQYREINGAGYKETYLHMLHKELSCIFSFCMKYYGLTVNPCTVAGPIGKYAADEMKIWTKEQFEEFIAQENIPSYHAAFNILFYGGLRRGELLALTPGDMIDEACALSIRRSFSVLEGKDLMLSTKSDSGRRIVTLPKTVYDELKKFVTDTDCAPNQRIFGFKYGGLWYQFRRCILLAQLPVIRIHDLRHSHVSMLIDMGFNVNQIAERVGHKSPATTMEIYAHLYPGRDVELANRLDEHLNGMQKGTNESSGNTAETAKNGQ